MAAVSAKPDERTNLEITHDIPQCPVNLFTFAAVMTTSQRLLKLILVTRNALSIETRPDLITAPLLFRMEAEDRSRIQRTQLTRSVQEDSAGPTRCTAHERSSNPGFASLQSVHGIKVQGSSSPASFASVHTS